MKIVRAKRENAISLLPCSLCRASTASLLPIEGPRGGEVRAQATGQTAYLTERVWAVHEDNKHDAPYMHRMKRQYTV